MGPIYRNIFGPAERYMTSRLIGNIFTKDVHHYLVHIVMSEAGFKFQEDLFCNGGCNFKSILLKCIEVGGWVV